MAKNRTHPLISKHTLTCESGYGSEERFLCVDGWKGGTTPAQAGPLPPNMGALSRLALIICFYKPILNFIVDHLSFQTSLFYI